MRSPGCSRAMGCPLVERRTVATPEEAGAAAEALGGEVARELDLIERGLGEPLYTLGRDWHLAEPVRDLLARFKQAQSSRSGTR
ncbi:MAG: hypothetical protein HY690_03160 [Chloroflexi bacterium]|nr:hypothetical protein [Chloroflexota bacterium]